MVVTCQFVGHTMCLLTAEDSVACVLLRDAATAEGHAAPVTETNEHRALVEY
jgi:hypothetical protein